MRPHGHGLGHQDRPAVLGPWEGEGEVWSTLLIMVDFYTSLRLHGCFEGFADSGTTSDRCRHHRGPGQLPETMTVFVFPGLFSQGNPSFRS